MPDITNIPSPRVPFVDPRTGLVSREWYLFLLNLFTLTGGGQSAATIQDALLSGSDLVAGETLKDLDALQTAPRAETTQLPDDVTPTMAVTHASVDIEPVRPVVVSFDDVSPRYEIKSFTLATETANGVIYLDASSKPTTGSILTFNGTTLTAGQTVRTGNGTGAADVSVEIGYNRTAGGAVWLDLCPDAASVGARLYRSYSTDILDLTNLGAGYTRFYQQGAGYMTFWVNFNERVRITPRGNTVVGYGGTATSATDGFLHVPACNGTPTGVPTAETAGNIPLVVDSANNKLYFYCNGAWRDAGP